MMRLNLMGLAAMMLLAVGCAHSIHEVHVSDFIPAGEIESGQVVKGYGEQFVILGITDETNYVNKAYQQVMSQCQGKRLTGLTTELSTSLNFFSWTNKATIQGLCL